MAAPGFGGALESIGDEAGLREGWSFSFEERIFEGRGSSNLTVFDA